MAAKVIGKNNSFSLESVMSSIYGDTNHKKSSASSRVFVKAGTMPTFFESCESVEYYAMASQEAYDQGNQFASFATLALESLSSNVKLVRNFKGIAKSKGMESASFSLEAGGIDVKAIVKKVVFAVKAAIQKFIIAVANFIKSISNWFGSQFVGAQEKIYNDAKKAGIGGLIGKAGDLKINTIKVAGDRAKIFDAGLFKGLDLMTAASAVVEVGLGGATNADGGAAAMANASKQISSAFTYLIQGNAEAKKYIDDTLGAEKGGIISKIPNGSVVAKIHVYGSTEAKAEEVSLKDFASEADYAILTKAHAQAFLAAVNVAKKSSAGMGKALKAADGIMAEVAKPNPEDQNAAKTKMRGLMFSKNIHGFNVSFLLTYYSIYLKERSTMARALKMMMGGAKPATAPATAPAK